VRRISALLALLALLALAALAGWLAAPAVVGGDAAPLVGPVVTVVDGDTLTVDLRDGRRTVRVIGVDTPEIAHGLRPAACYGVVAARRVEALLAGRSVRLALGAEETDRFGRTLATVEILGGPAAGRDLSMLLAAEGLARPLPIEPNTANAGAVASAVAGARRARLGLWGACGFAAAFPRSER
jgi:endonuclease YncB( thermonuclease family)